MKVLPSLPLWKGYTAGKGHSLLTQNVISALVSIVDTMRQQDLTHLWQSWHPLLGHYNTPSSLHDRIEWEEEEGEKKRKGDC